MNVRVEVYPSEEPGSREWWISVLMDVKYMGPYDTRKEAEEAARRIKNFFKHENEPGYVTCETRTKKDV